MTMICRLLGHAAHDLHYKNAGMEFSLCDRCGEDLIRAQDTDEWDLLPEGIRVVWRPVESDASAVAARMAWGPIAPRRGARTVPRRSPRALASPVTRARPIAGRSVLVMLWGKFMLAGIADKVSKPSAKAPEAVIRLPAPKAASRSTARSPRAKSPVRSAEPLRLTDRREIW